MKNFILRFLVWVGLTKRLPKGRWYVPVKFAPKWVWRSRHDFVAWVRFWGPFYLFRNKPGVIKWIPGRLLPRRWGFGIYGLIEIGDRG